MSSPGAGDAGPFRVLVTGGSGFSGRHVVSELRHAGAFVRVVDLNPHPDPTVDIVIGDIAEPETIEAAFDGGFDAVVHLAAVTSVLRSLEHPGEMPAVIVDPARALGAGWSPRFSFADGLVGVWDEWSQAELDPSGAVVAPGAAGGAR